MSGGMSMKDWFQDSVSPFWNCLCVGLGAAFQLKTNWTTPNAAHRAAPPSKNRLRVAANPRTKSTAKLKKSTLETFSVNQREKVIWPCAASDLARSANLTIFEACRT